MSDKKIKIKDLMGELNIPQKDMLQALKDLNCAAKTTQGSLTEEEVERVRGHMAVQNTDDSKENQPLVIVRRRKKEEAVSAPSPKEEAPVVAEKAEVVESVEPEVAPAPVAPAQEKGKEPAVVHRARIVSHPADTPPAVESASPKEVSEPVVPETPPVLDAVSTPEAAPVREKTEKRARTASASANPEGSSAPTLLPRSESKASEEGSANEAQEASAPAEPVSRVRVISRPQPGTTPRPAERRDDSRGAPRDGRPPRSGDGRGADNRGDRAPRPGGGAPGAGRPPRPGGGGARPPMGARPAGGAPSSFPPASGQPGADGREGQSKKKRLKNRRTVDFQQGDAGRHIDDDGMPRMNRGKSRRAKSKEPRTAAQAASQPLKAAKRKIRVSEAIRVADMAHQMGLKSNEIIKVLFGLGVMATINQSLDIDTATLVAAEFGYEVERAGFQEENYLIPVEEDTSEQMKQRPPVVTIMGHVDHGKTSLLDAIRKSNVTSGEAGGITQHIGAYHVKTKKGDIVFLDTPGHEAFTAMRARGAQVTDLVILVVAADDGVMEQTREAINHSKAAGVPIMVAVNKMDKAGADPDRVLRELAELGLQAEDWGGDTIVAKVSAKTREGLDELLELVALQAEVMELKANPDKAARGHIVEAKLDKGRGPVATVLIQQGTLHQGDNFVCGVFSGRVRALFNDQGKKVKEAGPSIPVEVQGFDGVPEAGEEFIVIADEKVARRIADSRAIKQRERELARESKVTLETFLSRNASDLEALTLNLVLKADVQGSLEAISESLLKQSTEKVRINVVHGGAGAISESDILLASASQAIIIGFNVRPTAKIKEVAERENVDIRFYDIIYKLVEDIKSAMAGMLAPVQREVYLGQAEVRETFSVPKVGVIAGSYVADGKMLRNAGVRLLRDGVVIYTGKISSLKRFKDDAKDVAKGNECGIGLENFNDIKVADIIEAFETVEEAATL